MTLVNFRCFGRVPQTITFEPDITSLVGENGSGKSTILEALKRLFSPISRERQIRRDDFYFAPSESIDDIDSRQLIIDVIFAFPELAESDGVEGHGLTVPIVFNDMYLDSDEGQLKARVRLEAEWLPTDSFEDDVDYTIYWITTMSSEVDFGGDHPNKYPSQILPDGRSLRFNMFLPHVMETVLFVWRWHSSLNV